MTKTKTKTKAKPKVKPKVAKKSTTKKVVKKPVKKVVKKPVKKSTSAKNASSRKIKIGVFGGTFNPVHYGHLNSLETVADVLKLKKVLLVPNSQNPLRERVEGPTAAERLQMTKLALSSLNQKNKDQFEISDLEVERGGVSYTIETLRELSDQYPQGEFYFVIGMDQISTFVQWKDFDEILQLSNLVVTSRPGAELPKHKSQLPAWLADRMKSMRGDVVTLNTGRKLYFVQLKDLDISGTDIRRRARRGDDVSQYTPTAVAEFIEEHKLYDRLGSKISDYGDFTRFCAKILEDKGGINVQGYDVRELEQPTEFTLVASGTSSRHTLALSEHVIKAVKDEFGVYPQAREGMQEGRWIVIDYGSLMVHLFYDYVRNEYRLEDLWRNGTHLQL